MSIVIVCPGRDMGEWVAAIRSVDPALHVQVWPDVVAPSDVLLALCWEQPPNALDPFPNLKCISSLGAGVEHLLRHDTLPEGYPSGRHERITVTPHIASVTDPGSAAYQVVDNCHRIPGGEPLRNLVDAERGY